MEIASEALMPVRGSFTKRQLEQHVWPWALGRKIWRFTGSLRSGKHAAAIMSWSNSHGSMGMFRTFIVHYASAPIHRLFAKTQSREGALIAKILIKMITITDL
ncbi:hypothetical protein OO306_19235 [Pseudomonas sp. DCB_AW]|uniref:hypothetical protein n=1 Tax=Pseudomonas sp. DCB_AW TaxID=2993596 RepID=UPI0022493446|nr:hypothetical protein [Pseudomonas sp. DCB_AW]MCX2687669.1 hypothetical protein [Pseudomonas sp. DCB_AW]